MPTGPAPACARWGRHCTRWPGRAIRTQEYTARWAGRVVCLREQARPGPVGRQWRETGVGWSRARIPWSSPNPNSVSQIVALGVRGSAWALRCGLAHSPECRLRLEGMANGRQTAGAEVPEPRVLTPAQDTTLPAFLRPSASLKRGRSGWLSKADC